MTLYDGLMLGIVVLGMVWGAWRGITWQVAGIASLVLGYIFAETLSPQIAPKFPGDPLVQRGLAMLAIYVATSGGIYVVAWMIRATLRKLQFEAYDRHLGMMLGGAEGALLGMVLTLFVVSFAPNTRQPIFESPSGKVVGKVMAAVGPVLPKEARDVLQPFLDGTETRPAEQLQASFSELDELKKTGESLQKTSEILQRTGRTYSNATSQRR